MHQANPNTLLRHLAQLPHVAARGDVDFVLKNMKIKEVPPIQKETKVNPKSKIKVLPKK